MKTPKMTLGNVLLLIAALSLGFTAFLSMNFITLGNTKESIIGALITSIVLAGLAFAAQRFKKTNRNFKTNIILEIVFLILFVVAGYFALQPFSHVFTVMQEKEAITNKVGNNLEQAKLMFNKYEDYANNRIAIYESALKAAVANKASNPDEYEAFGFKNGPRTDSDQIGTMLFSIENNLFPSNYEQDSSLNDKGIKGEAIKYLENVKSNLHNDFGFMFGIVNTINEVPERIEGWKEKLIDLSEFRAQNEPDSAEDFEYMLDFKTIKAQLTTVKSPTIWSVLLMVLSLLLMILPYLLAKRSTKFPGFKMLFSSNESAGNEL